MLKPDFTAQFRRDLRKAERRGYDMDKIKDVITQLLGERPLSPVFRDHPLKGEWKDCHELHIAPDWLLIYKIGGEICVFYRTGTHSDLFGK